MTTTDPTTDTTDTTDTTTTDPIIATVCPRLMAAAHATLAKAHRPIPKRGTDNDYIYLEPCPTGGVLVLGMTLSTLFVGHDPHGHTPKVMRFTLPNAVFHACKKRSKAHQENPDKVQVNSCGQVTVLSMFDEAIISMGVPVDTDPFLPGWRQLLPSDGQHHVATKAHTSRTYQVITDVHKILFPGKDQASVRIQDYEKASGTAPSLVEFVQDSYDTGRIYAMIIVMPMNVEPTPRINIPPMFRP